MHILIAPNPNDIPLHTWPAGGGRHDVLQLANLRRAASDRWPANSWNDLLARCPDGWTPDVYICWSLEYRPVPEGIEHADCLTVGVIGDWNLGGQAFHQIGGAFDLLVADRNGCDRLRAAGFDNVLYWPLWGYDPLRHHVIAGLERDIDVAIIGNFNHHIQRERAPWLARIARMSRRRRVLVAGGIFGRDYTHALNRAKIVFNRSIRGEINMRAYEAAACGALMFYERENREIRELFRDREECVLYGEGDLEDLLEHYLRNADERVRIADAARQRVEPCTYAAQAAGLFDRIEEWRAQSPPGKRRFLQLSRDEQNIRRVRQWTAMPHGGNIERAAALLDDVRDVMNDVTDRHHARVCLLAQDALDQARTPAGRRRLQEARDLCFWLLKLDPARASARMNYAEILLALGNDDAAGAEFEEALRLLRVSSPTFSQVDGPYLPRLFNSYTVEIEQLWTEPDVSSDAWCRRVGDHLEWRCHHRLAEIDLRQNCLEKAVARARTTASMKPELSASWLLLARCHRAAGQLAAAATAYRRAYDLVPLDVAVGAELLAVLGDLGAESELRAVAEDLLAIIDGCPNCEDMRTTVEQLASRRYSDRRIKTLVAAPDWSDPGAWRPLVGEFARTFRRQEDATLALLVDPRAVPDLTVIVDGIEEYLLGTEELPHSDWPDLHVIHQGPAVLELADACEWVDAICPAPSGPPVSWLPAVPRMTVETFHVAFTARRPAVCERAA